MRLEEKQIILKNGKEAILKSPQVEDAENMLNFIIKACGETEYLLRYPEEYNISLEQEKGWVNGNLSSPDDLAITCFVDGRVAGNCVIHFKRDKKTSHLATIDIAILKEFWNLGIGSAMFKELIDTARASGTEIIELEFIEGNERAKRLYEKFGFRIVCEKPNVIKLKDGTYLKNFYMQKYMK